MKRLLLPVAGALALLAVGMGATSVAAQSRPAASAWWDTYGRGQTNEILRLQAAEAQRRARDGGYGPAQNSTTIEGDYNETNTYQGPVNNSTAYNCVNCSTTDIKVNGDGNTVGVTTGQHSNNANQDADSDILVGRITTRYGCGSVGQC